MQLECPPLEQIGLAETGRYNNQCLHALWPRDLISHGCTDSKCICMNGSAGLICVLVILTFLFQGLCQECRCKQIFQTKLHVHTWKVFSKVGSFVAVQDEFNFTTISLFLFACPSLSLSFSLSLSQLHSCRYYNWPNGCWRTITFEKTIARLCLSGGGVGLELEKCHEMKMKPSNFKGISSRRKL